MPYFFFYLKYLETTHIIKCILEQKLFKINVWTACIFILSYMAPLGSYTKHLPIYTDNSGTIENFNSVFEQKCYKFSTLSSDTKHKGLTFKFEAQRYSAFLKNIYLVNILSQVMEKEMNEFGPRDIPRVAIAGDCISAGNVPPTPSIPTT